MAKELSQAKCVLLAVHYASSSDVKSLHSFTPGRFDVFDPELVLRILLTYLPESIDPHEYITYVSEVGTRLYLDVSREEVAIDTAPVASLTEEQASRKVKKLHLLDLRAPAFPPHAPTDVLTTFICHRAYRIEAETGLLEYIPILVTPFLSRNEFIRTWYIGVVLPIVRLSLEYYTNDEAVPQIDLKDFEQLDEQDAIDLLLQKAWSHDKEAIHSNQGQSKSSILARDVKGVVGPWMYGHTERKRRRLAGEQVEHASHQIDQAQQEDQERATLSVRKVSLTGVSAADKTDHDWESLFRWLVLHCQESFGVVANCIEEWEGPTDVDLGQDEAQSSQVYLDKELRGKLELQYCQSAFAACYAAEQNTETTIRAAHGILARLAELLDFIPPPDLATSVDSLPRIEQHTTKLDQSQTLNDLAPDSLLRPEHPLTTPRLETYMLLQMILYSSYQFLGLGNPISLVNVAKLHFYASSSDQNEILRKILRTLSESSGKRDDFQWTAERGKLIWLWGWGITKVEADDTGAGVLGKIPKTQLERSFLHCLVDVNRYNLASQIYLDPESSLLPPDEFETVVLDKAMEAYDGASNGNRSRGGVKKANDIITTFRPKFPNSKRFKEAISLISATHALSFYSLTLQHGVPFTPVSIRVSQDPIRLIEKVLEQNPKSYTKLDDLINIGTNLTSAGLKHSDNASATISQSSNQSSSQSRQEDIRRRVTFMAIEAALREDDFETAYSYTVNHLTPSGIEIDVPKDAPNAMKHTRVESRSTVKRNEESQDDISWRAAFMAGRFRTASSAPPTLRRLEQRTELLSLALLLAPTPALTEVLAAWRRCEEEASALQQAQQEAADEFDDQADKRGSKALPGNFVVDGEQPAMILNQKRREIGRPGAGRGAKDETPLSMFDLTRSAARAFSQTAFPLRSASDTKSHESPRASVDGVGALDASIHSLGSDGGDQRVRKRDMVASAVSGGLASGIGWMLGATPSKVDGQGQQQQR